MNDDSFSFYIPESKRDKEGMRRFAEALEIIDKNTGFKVSSRGWCYQLENMGVLRKGDFDKVQDMINWMRKKGYLQVDFTAEDTARYWSEVHKPEEDDPALFMAKKLSWALDLVDDWTPIWWEDEEYYLQMMVEKKDLKTLFQPLCRRYHIPITNAKGWSDINQRARMMQRFKEAEERGSIPVLLYCGDYDPFGVVISDRLKTNLGQLSKAKGVEWEPENLIVDRFGLNQDFIEDLGLSWIENLETGSGKSLADPAHKNHDHPAVQRWLREVGERKVEANALVVYPEEGRKLCEDSILEWLGEGVLERFEERAEEHRKPVDAVLRKIDKQVGFRGAIIEALGVMGYHDGDYLKELRGE